MLWSVRIATNSGGSFFILCMGDSTRPRMVARAAAVSGALSRLAPHLALRSAINTMPGSLDGMLWRAGEPYSIVLMADALTAVASIGDHR
jgi:hypothetical protein